MPPELLEKTPQKNTKDSVDLDVQIDPANPVKFPYFTLNTFNRFPNGDLKGYGFLSSEYLNLKSDFDFSNGNNFGAYSDFKFEPSGLNLQQYGFDAGVSLAEGIKANGRVDVNIPNQTAFGELNFADKENIYKLGGQMNIATGIVNNLSADMVVNFSDTVNADGSIIYDGIGQTLTGTAKVTEKDNIYNLGGQLNTATGTVNNLNADAAVRFSDTVNANGSVIYDGIGQTLTGTANVIEKENVYNFGGQINTATGIVNNLNADAAVRFSNAVNANGSVIYDGIGQTLTGTANVTEKENVYNLGGQVNTATGVVNNLSADATVKFSNTVNADGSVIYDGIGQTLTGKASITEKENIFNFGGQLNTANGGLNSLNADAAITFSDSLKANGSLIYDGIGQTLTGKFDATEKANLFNLGGQLNTATGSFNNINADASLSFSDTVKAKGSLLYDGIGQTLTGKANVTEKENIYNIGGQLNTATGSFNNLNVDATVKFSDTVKGSGSLIYDGIGQTLTGKFDVVEKNNTYNFGTQLNTATGSFNRINADAAVSFGENIKGNGSLIYDGANQTLTGKLGVTEKDNAYNFGTQFNTATGRFNSINADARFGFNNGAGSISFDGSASAKTLEAGAAINYKNSNLEYSAQARFNNQSGAFGLSELSGKLSTVGDSKHRFSVEAGYKPNQNDAFVKVGYTFSFGSPVTKPLSPQQFATQSTASIDSEVSRFREVQSIALLSPQDKKLHDQALAGVEKLNAGGAGLPVAQTAASLAALAKSENLLSIGYVSLGKETPSGQNIIIGDSNNPNNPAGNRAHMPKAEAVNTPVAESIQKLQQQSNDAPQVTDQSGQKKNQFHM